MTVGLRTLTYDEQKAAEAAFLGLPLNPKWTKAGQAVYLGLRAAIIARESSFPTLSDQIVELEVSSV